MDLFAKRLRERARQLNLSDAEVARRVGLAERRYGHYVRNTHEPDYATLVRICEALDVTPNDLLLPAPAARPSPQERWLSRLVGAGRMLSLDDLQLAVRQVEVLLQQRQSAKRR
jgi:transcriptional regulator with XRE-family HTH domain